MPKINQEEYGVLKGLDDKWKWIARNYNGALIIYTSKPMENPNLYWDGFGKRMDDRLFQFIQWEDEEPHNIAELIEEYECSAEHVSHVVNERVKALGNAWSESEETEVKKDIGWLKEQIWKQDIVMDKGYIYTDDLMSIINEVDEPEVLSQGWIKDHELLSTEKDADGNVHADRYIHVKDLQNLLVPKQELPVIPQFVADFIENRKGNMSLYGALDDLGIKLLKESQWREWNKKRLGHNGRGETQELIARAWLDGFTVEEEEQEYVVPVDENHALCKFANDTWGIYKEDIDKLYLDDDFKFTEQEIKDFDERYWPFAKHVEEV